MTLLDNIRKVYQAKFRCTNCKQLQMSSISKGITVKEFLTTNKSVCSNCGCPLELEENK
jgi:transcription elongation factor Elf1